ncbi:MAG: CaiA [Firmicutes bacterium]|nr:CaiA [Bacillota bacterium]
MDFNQTEEQSLIRSMIREFAQTEVAPKAAELDENERFPVETMQRLAELDLTGMTLPREYGGAGLDYISYAIVIEELSRACASTALILAVHTLAGIPLYQFGTEEQRKKWLPKLVNYELLGAFALTEPGAGTDAGSLQATAVLDQSEYVLNGTKTFITNGAEAGLFIVMALTEQGVGTKGISAFLVEKGTPGLSVGKHERKMGMRGSSTTELVLKNCRIPRENLLGKEGQGFKIAMAALDSGRISIAAQSVGIAQACIDESVNYAKERIQFKRPLAANQAIQWMLAEMETDVNAARLLTYEAAHLKETGAPVSNHSAMAKLFASVIAERCASKAVQIHGGYGYVKDFAVERLYRDARVLQIYEGTSEVQKMVIAGHLLR